jgi:hypothetical protein
MKRVTNFTATEMFHITESFKRWHSMIFQACGIRLIGIFGVEIPNDVSVIWKSGGE